MKNAMKFLSLLILMVMVSATAWAMSRRPANEGTTVNVYVNNATAKSEAYWACRDANFKKASQLDASGKVIVGTTDYAKMDELNKTCVL